MLFGGYEHWMLRFWTLRKLDATLLDALIATRSSHNLPLFAPGLKCGWWVKVIPAIHDN